MKRDFSNFIIRINKIAVVILLLLSIISITFPIFIFHYGGRVSLIHYFEIHHTIMRLFSFVILILSWKLYKRVNAAWFVVMIVLSLQIFQYVLIHREHINNPFFLIEVACYFLLLLSKNYYVRKSDKFSLKRGISIYLFYAAFVFFNAAIALLRVKGTVSFSLCLEETVGILFDLENMAPAVYSPHTFYHSFLFWFSWICILAGLVAVMTPYVGLKAHNQEEMKKARELVKRYGQNCSSYLTLEKDKSYLFGKTVHGVIAYGIAGDVFVALGDPICAPEDFRTFLSEIKRYCEDNAYSLLFLNTTSEFLGEYEKAGMGYVKCGEEPRFYLPEYSIAGGAASKVRLNINHATKAGMTIREYDPRKMKNAALEKEITEVSREWLTMKKSGELVFTMGGMGLENPMDRRYFYAVDLENRMQAFIVFVPFAGMNGYVADVTRYRTGAARGVIEKIFYEAMMQFKEEGVEWGSLAAAPLARLEEERDVTAKLLNLIYERMNGVYGFKALYQAKLKYNPTCWEPNYYVYHPAVFTPAMAYAIVKIQNPLGVRDYVSAFFRNISFRRAVNRLRD